MIRADRQQAALYAIHHALARTRTMAQKQNVERIADILDDLEILPAYIADPREDLTETFRITLEGLAERHPQFTHIAEQFAAGHDFGWPQRKED